MRQADYALVRVCTSECYAIGQVSLPPQNFTLVSRVRLHASLACFDLQGNKFVNILCSVTTLVYWQENDNNVDAPGYSKLGVLGINGNNSCANKVCWMYVDY